jgi:hypothetical protein
MSGSNSNPFTNIKKQKSSWVDDPKSLLKESDFSTAQKSMRTEVLNKTNTLRNKSLPIPGEGDDRNWLEKKLNTPQKTGLLGDVLDVISRGQYASANIAKTLSDNKNDSLTDVLSSGYRGLSGQDKTSYRDVLAQSGMEQGKLRSALGFAGDVLLDPTTYLTLGTGTAAKIGGKTAAKGLGKVIPKALGKEAIDKGGLKFMGASIIPGSVIEKGAEKAGIFKAGNLLRDSKPVQVLGKGLVPNFREAGTNKEAWEAFVDTKRGYQNSLSYAQEKAVEDAIKMGKGFTSAERTLATHAIQNPQVYRFLEPKVQKLADVARKSFDESATLEQSLGLLKTPRANYVPGIYPEKAKGFLEGITKKDGLRASIGSFGKQKKYDTLQDAITAGLKPETDIAKLVGSRQIVSARATETQKFINETLEKHGTKISSKNIDKIDPSMGVYLPKGSLAFFPSGTVPDEFLQLVKGMNKDDLIEIPAGAIRSGMMVSKNVPVYALPKQIAGELNNFRKIQSDEGSKGLLGAYDAVLNLWKGYATAVNPGFHARNAQSNIFQSSLIGAKALANPLNHAKAAAVMASDTPILKNIAPWIDNNLVKGANSVDVNGVKMALPEVKELMKKEGVIGNGWFARDIPNYIGDKLDAGLSSKLTPKSIAQFINPLSQKNGLIRGGRAVGSGVENQARSFNFLSELKKTGDIKQSAKTVDKTLFDYGDVTPFEKNVLKRTVPFYTWMRKNVPLQAENIIRTPGKYSATKKAFDGVRDLSAPVNEENMPDYMNNPNWVKTPITQDGNPMYWNANLPTGDLEKLNPNDLNKTILGSLSPILKAPLELEFNQNSFFGDKIEKYQGEMKKAPSYLPNLPEPVVKMLGAQYGVNKEGVNELQVPAKVRYLMSQVPFMENVSKSLDLKGDKQFNQLLSFLMGSKIAPFDAKKAEMNALYEQRDALRNAFDKFQTQGILASDEDLAEEKKKIKKSTNPFK